MRVAFRSVVSISFLLLVLSAFAFDARAEEPEAGQDCQILPEQTPTGTGYVKCCQAGCACSVGDVMVNAFGSGTKSCIAIDDLGVGDDSDGIIISDANGKFKVVALGFSSLSSEGLSDPAPRSGTILLSKAELSDNIKSQIMSSSEFNASLSYLRQVKDKIWQNGFITDFTKYGPGWDVTDMIFETRSDEDHCSYVSMYSQYTSGSKTFYVSGEQSIGVGVWTSDGKLCYIYKKGSGTSISDNVVCDASVSTPTNLTDKGDVALNILVRSGTRKPSVSNSYADGRFWYGSNTAAPYYTAYDSATHFYGDVENEYSVPLRYALMGTWLSQTMGYNLVSMECGDEGNLLYCYEDRNPNVGGDGEWRRAIYYAGYPDYYRWPNPPTSPTLENAVVDECFLNSILYDSDGNITGYAYNEYKSIDRIYDSIPSFRDEYNNSIKIAASNRFDSMDPDNYGLALNPSDGKCYDAGFKEYNEYYRRAVHPKPQLGLIYKTAEIDKAELGCKTQTCPEGYYNSEGDCKTGIGEGLKCVEETISSNSCYKRMSKTCSDYSTSSHTYYDSMGYCAQDLSNKPNNGAGYKCSSVYGTSAVGGLSGCTEMVAKTCADYKYEWDWTNHYSREYYDAPNGGPSGCSFACPYHNQTCNTYYKEVFETKLGGNGNIQCRTCKIKDCSEINSSYNNPNGARDEKGTNGDCGMYGLKTLQLVSNGTRYCCVPGSSGGACISISFLNGVPTACEATFSYIVSCDKATKYGSDVTCNSENAYIAINGQGCSSFKVIVSKNGYSTQYDGGGININGCGTYTVRFQ